MSLLTYQETSRQSYYLTAQTAQLLSGPSGGMRGYRQSHWNHHKDEYGGL